MKHASAESLVTFATLLDQVRLVPGLIEKKPGIFYRRGQAFLHFHEDAAGMFADVKSGTSWLRLKVDDLNGDAELLEQIESILS